MKIADIAEPPKIPESKIKDQIKLLESSALTPITEKGVIKEVPKNNVLSFPPKVEEIVPKEFVLTEKAKKKIPIKEFYTLKCECGKERLNLFQARLCRRGEAGSPEYNATTDTFKCQNCENEQEKKANNAD